MNIPHIEQVVSQYGDFSGWLALAFIIVKEVIIPFAKKLTPVKAKAISREEDRKDRETEFNQQVQLRTVETLESLNKNAIQQTELFRVTNERLTAIEKDVKEIKIEMPRKKATAK